MKAEMYGISDGFGEVGKGFICPWCAEKNEFVDEDETELVCEHCGNLVEFEDIK